MLKKIYNAFEEYFACALFLLIFLLMVVGVILRYFFSISFAWNIELSRYSFVWLTFVGASYARKDDTHIKIDLFYNLLRKRIPNWLHVFFWVSIKVLIIGYLLLLVYLSINLSVKSWRFRSQAMQISQSYLYISVALGSLMFVGREIVDTIKKMRSGNY
ncbi:MAG: TRAP transporter small permease [Treponemataceae bacterium]